MHTKTEARPVETIAAAQPKRFAIIPALGALGGVVAAAAGLLALLTGIGVLRSVPDVFGGNEPSGYTRLVAAGFTVHEIYETNDKLVAGMVIRTDPTGNSQVWRASSIRLYVSTGPRTTTPTGLPNIYDLPLDTAATQLAGAGYTARIVHVCSHSVVAGHVRQVILADRSPEVILVDKAGPTAAARGVKTNQTVIVKVSTGVACS